MTARGTMRGHDVHFDGLEWVYDDTGDPAPGERACALCDKPPTFEGHDPCIGHVEGVDSACCGHGIEPAATVRRGEFGPCPLCLRDDGHRCRLVDNRCTGCGLPFASEPVARISGGAHLYCPRCSVPGRTRGEAS